MDSLSTSLIDLMSSFCLAIYGDCKIWILFRTWDKPEWFPRLRKVCSIDEAACLNSPVSDSLSHQYLSVSL